ncbi:hypothetical protein [Streptomyces sp. NPDC013455]|uniref:hypothetical protein n=1 Tax=Streptomyces sp. NPDC013455 TaxID=3155605 RepID=UPI0033EE5981
MSDKRIFGTFFVTLAFFGILGGTAAAAASGQPAPTGHNRADEPAPTWSASTDDIIWH